MTGARLSVIVTSTTTPGDLPACLAELAAQCRDQRAEIILACAADDPVPPELIPCDAGVILIRLPRTATLPRLLGAALACATGEIIAMTDATCQIDRGWVAAILQAHEAHHWVIGGATEPGHFKKLVDWAAYLCEYGQFMLPLAEGRVSEVPGNNLSLKRPALTRARRFVDGQFWKTYWCRALQAEGIPLYSTPSVVVRCGKSFGLGSFLIRRFHHGRCFAGMRLAQLPGAKRALYLAASPLLPVLFGARVLKGVLPKGRYRQQLFLSFPIIALALVTWALGEFCGYLCGPGTSCRHVR